MEIEEFKLERFQSLYENTVDINLSESGVHPYTLQALLAEDELRELVSARLGYGWTNGSEQLREAIAALYENRGPDEVVATNGSAEANFVLVMTLLEPGDELLVLVPNYLQIVGWAKALGVTVKSIPLREREGWLPDLEAIEEAVSPRTRMITLCNPNNPTGAVLSDSYKQALVNVCRRHDIYLHADEIYKGSELFEPEGSSFADLYEKSIVTNGLSKAMALPGLRIGWLVGPGAVISSAWHRKDYTSITTTTLSELTATMILAPARRSSILDRSKSILRANLSIVQHWIEDNSRYFSLVPPQAGGMAFMRYSMDVNSTDLVNEIRRRKSVLPVPGDAFGLDKFIRVGIGLPQSELKEGLARISDFVRESGYKAA